MYQNILLLLISFTLFTTLSIAQPHNVQFFPEDAQLNADIPTPESYFGFNIGDWHLSHDKLVYYMYELARHSNRIKIEQIGFTYEHRPLLNVIFSAPENINDLEKVRKDHISQIYRPANDSIALEDVPLVLWLGYSVHGNEASGGNAAALVAYYLAASQDEWVVEMLKKNVIIIDPCLNPDGFQRFSNWVNVHKSKNLSSDENSREFDEVWPGGRTNHYWFDLNRDWLLLRHPESRARVTQFHKWRPNVLTDHHEMGSNSTFFFQPGVPSRNHPLTPNKAYELTKEISKFHARALDKKGEFYYSEETFDDFYYGKGSTYPDINGGIGILFEQSRVRGHLRSTENGERHFADAISNQVTVSFSTMKAAVDLKKDLLIYQKNFRIEAMKSADDDEFKAYIFGHEHDPYRSAELADLLLQHQIRLYQPVKDISVDDTYFPAGSSYVVPLNQEQYRLIKALFERRTSFKDSIFYDISAWSMDLAFNVQFKRLNNKNIPDDLIGEVVESIKWPVGGVDMKSEYAYAFEWHHYHSPALLYQLQKRGVQAKVATQPFFDQEGNKFDIGSIMVPVPRQNLDANTLYDVMEHYSEKYYIPVTGFASGNDPFGPDLGSPSFEVLQKPRIIQIVGDGIRAYEAGEIWHLLDERMNMHVTNVPIENFDRLTLNEYNVIVMPAGNYGRLSQTDIDKIESWARSGGTIVAQKSAIPWLAQQKLSTLQLKRNGYDSLAKMNYLEYDRWRDSKRIGGAIFKTRIDPTHPLCYGYTSQFLPVFRNSTLFLEGQKYLYESPVQYTQKPLISGYISKDNLNQLKGTPAVQINRIGKGRVIAFTDNHNFRAFWYGTNKLFLNSLFFGNVIRY
ncbi:MAG TPA: zinc carboxypeptidase [Cytophagales bacterium]|jgi:hypothetical protein|nr:zinc carboxypeptidase [Cytophagales bacterium]